MKRITIISVKFIGKILFIYFIYIVISGILVFRIYKPTQSDYIKKHSVERFWGEDVGPDRVVLIEERKSAEIARLNIIENARETLDISYYSIKDGVSAELFLSSILEAADRGVKVRLIVDGITNNLKNVIYTFVDHPNIEMKLFEPLNILKPWSWNNRLHDKYLIADQNMAIIGGRNIGDRFFTPDNYEGLITNDRDVLILNTHINNENSVVKEMLDYFNNVWNHEFAKYPLTKLTDSQQDKAHKYEKYLKENLNAIRIYKPDKFNTNIDWLEQTLPTNKITLIHNPLDRFNKEPWCWYEITNLMKRAEKDIFIQSPYVVPTKAMLKYINKNEIKAENVTILTNSVASNPNYLAATGYLHNRKNIIDTGAQIYEYQGPESLHAKSVMIDNRITLIGSFNIDSRSTFLSAETMVVIDSVDFADQFKNEINNIKSQSLLVESDYSYQDNYNVEKLSVTIPKKLLLGILSLITYFIQYML